MSFCRESCLQLFHENKRNGSRCPIYFISGFGRRIYLADCTMSNISVGEVSGIIAAAVFLGMASPPSRKDPSDCKVQFLLPLAIPGILIAFITEKNSLITW